MASASVSFDTAARAVTDRLISRASTSRRLRPLSFHCFIWFPPKLFSGSIRHRFISPLFHFSKVLCVENCAFQRGFYHLTISILRSQKVLPPLRAGALHRPPFEQNGINCVSPCRTAPYFTAARPPSRFACYRTVLFCGGTPAGCGRHPAEAGQTEWKVSPRGTFHEANRFSGTYPGS